MRRFSLSSPRADGNNAKQRVNSPPPQANGRLAASALRENAWLTVGLVRRLNLVASLWIARNVSFTLQSPRR